MGYHRAGFDVVGVDIEYQPNYPFEFMRADALEVLAEMAAGADWFIGRDGGTHQIGVDAVHTSPPCQAYSRTQRLRGREHPDLIEATRELLRAADLPYVIENVPEAPLLGPVILCGTQFGLRADGFELRRHRAFVCSFPLMRAPCHHELPAAPVFGHSPNQWFRKKYGRGFDNELRRQIMGTPWIAWDEIGEAIPPAYTEHIGHYLMAEVEGRRRSPNPEQDSAVHPDRAPDPPATAPNPSPPPPSRIPR